MKTIRIKWLFSLLLFLTCNAWAQWQGCGFGSYYTRCFATDGTNLFAGTHHNAYLSTNNGNSWTWQNNGLPSYVYSMAINGANVYAGTNAGIFFSNNNGNSWVNIGLTTSYVNAIEVSGTNLFAGTNTGVFLSTDNGNSWTSVNNGLTNLTVHILKANGSGLFAGTSAGLFLSVDNGGSWTLCNNGLPGGADIRAFVVDSPNIFAGTSGSGVFLSTDGGSSWTAVNSGLGNLSIWGLAVSGTQIFAGTLLNGVYMSSNNGSSWTYIGLSGNQVTAAIVSGTTLFIGTNDAVFRYGTLAGLNESLNNGTQILITPNPTNGTITLACNDNSFQVLQLTITNTLGEQIHKQKINSEKTEINLTNHPDGIYFVTVRDEKNTLAVKKIVKM